MPTSTYMQRIIPYNQFSNQTNKMTQVSLLLLSFTLYFLSVTSHKSQITNLKNILDSRRSFNPPNSESWSQQHLSDLSPVHIVPQEGSSKADKIKKLPGQPEVEFEHYSGYVTVNSEAGRALFYYLAESPQNSSTKPLVLWLNGGPGCSSFGYGAMEEIGPFRVNSDGKTLYRNPYAWNKVANVIFLESPAGVGFSYSNTSSDHITSGDKQTAKDSYTFIINWLERYPQYKSRDFFITGESYAGHYVPQLASLILSQNKKSNQTPINLKGIAIGNALIDETTWLKGSFEFYWTHALISDETHAGIKKYCDFEAPNYSSKKCNEYQGRFGYEVGDGIDLYNIYGPLCHPSDIGKPAESLGSIKSFDPCTDDYVFAYLNLPQVQHALHARKTSWKPCGGPRRWTGSPTTVMPVVKELSQSGIRVWVYSGDVDGVVPVTSTRDLVNKMKLPLESSWRPWYCSKEVGGYVVVYKGVVMVTVRGSGHAVPSYQPERAMVMITAFLQGRVPA